LGTIHWSTIAEISNSANFNAGSSERWTKVSTRTCLSAFSSSRVGKVVETAVYEASACERICKISQRTGCHAKVCTIIRIVWYWRCWAAPSHIANSINRWCIVIRWTYCDAQWYSNISIVCAYWASRYANPRNWISIGWCWASWYNL